jgi:hypothetical protein
MTIDDRVGKALEIYEQELKTDIAVKAAKIAIEQIPHFGSQIVKVLFGDAQKRIAERAKDVFDAVRERVERLDKDKIDKTFFESDEFLTIIILVIEQLQTTHDKQKLEMLANAITNSGTTDFSSDTRKELFLRIFRSLAPEHIAELQRIRPKELNQAPGTIRAIEVKGPKGENLAILQTLAANGLVDEHQEFDPNMIPSRFSNENQVKEIIGKFMRTPPLRCFKVSSLGKDFLEFFDEFAQGKAVPKSS